MEENISETESISKNSLALICLVAGKRRYKFLLNVSKLRVLIFVKMLCAIGISKKGDCLKGFLGTFGFFVWRQNGIIKALTVTGLVTFLAAVIGLHGCQK